MGDLAGGFFTGMPSFQSRLRTFALKCLTGKELTQAQLRPRLEKWCRLADSQLNEDHARTVTEVMAELVEDGWISDERAAQAWIRHYANRGKGAAFVQQKLREKGITQSREEIDEVIRNHTGVDESESILALIQRKYPDLHQGRNQKARALRGLQSRGFGTSAIFLAFRKWEESLS